MGHCIFFKRRHKTHEPTSQEIRDLIEEHRENLAMAAYDPVETVTIVQRIDDYFNQLLRQHWAMLWKKYNKDLSADTLAVLTIFNRYFNNQVNPDEALSKLSDETKRGELSELIHDFQRYRHFLLEKAQYENSVSDYLEKLCNRNIYMKNIDTNIHKKINRKPDVRSELLSVFYGIADMIWKGEYTIPHEHLAQIKQFYEREKPILANLQFTPIPIDNIENSVVRNHPNPG